MNPLELFSPDYFTARKRFREESQSHGGTLSQHPIGTAGHTVDLARLGPEKANELLILSSGLHGVEGPFGSAVQLGFLDTLLKQIPPSMGVLLIHALNPIGFDQKRRFNEDNIDLNRNFLDVERFPKLRQESLNSLYATLDPYLNPPSPPGFLDTFPFIAVWLLLRYGRNRLRQTLPVGQYAFPKGLFFGGDKLAESTRLVMDQIDAWVGPAQRVLHLDWHTGLGDWGTYKMLCNRVKDDPKAKQARDLFGESVETSEGETSYRSRGDFGEWLMKHFSQREYLYLCVEFGTYSNTYTLKKLRKENRVEHYTRFDDPIRVEGKQELSEVFVPTSTEWRSLVIEQSLEIVQQGLKKWASQLVFVSTSTTEV